MLLVTLKTGEVKLFDGWSVVDKQTQRICYGDFQYKDDADHHAFKRLPYQVSNGLIGHGKLNPDDFIVVPRYI